MLKMAADHPIGIFPRAGRQRVGVLQVSYTAMSRVFRGNTKGTWEMLMEKVLHHLGSPTYCSTLDCHYSGLCKTFSIDLVLGRESEFHEPQDSLMFGVLSSTCPLLSTFGAQRLSSKAFSYPRAARQG